MSSCPKLDQPLKERLYQSNGYYNHRVDAPRCSFDRKEFHGPDIGNEEKSPDVILRERLLLLYPLSADFTAKRLRSISGLANKKHFRLLR